MATIAEELAKLAVTDTFNRAEEPLAGEWKLLKPGVKTGKTEATEKGWTPVSLFGTGPDGAYWSKASFAAAGAKYVAALARITKIPTEAERFVAVWVLRNKAAPETSENGYVLRAELLAKGGKKIKFTLEKWVAGVPTVLKTVESEAYGAGSRIAIVSNGAKVFFFASKEKESAFEELAVAEDATYNEGYSAVYGKGTGEFKLLNFATGEFNLEEAEGIHKPNAASATASAPAPEISAPLQPGAITANASMPSIELAGGPAASATERNHHGLPLPFPSILANPGRLGPPRFTASERKTLRMRER
jgi:hypothetical protein